MRLNRPLKLRGESNDTPRGDSRVSAESIPRAAWPAAASSGPDGEEEAHLLRVLNALQHRGARSSSAVTRVVSCARFNRKLCCRCMAQGSLRNKNAQNVSYHWKTLRAAQLHCRRRTNSVAFLRKRSSLRSARSAFAVSRGDGVDGLRVRVVGEELRIEPPREVSCPGKRRGHPKASFRKG